VVSASDPTGEFSARAATSQESCRDESLVHVQTPRGSGIREDNGMNSIALHAHNWRELFRGAVREALAAASSVAKIGIQETRAWERPMRYIADDNQGIVGVVEFRTDGAIAAMSARAPGRALDCRQTIELAPPRLRESLSLLCELALLQEGLGVSEVFWTVGESIEGPDTWDEMCRHGAELFAREVLSDAEWLQVGAAYYGLRSDVARTAIEVAARAIVDIPILRLSEPEVALLVPAGSKHKTLALDLLTSEGMLEVPSIILRE